MEPHAEVSRDIAATPEAVFAAITDIAQMAELSPENHLNEWHEGFDRAEVGAMWTGHNRNGDKEWKTQSRIVEMLPGEKYVFDCLARDTVFATWAYTIEPTTSGCRVTEGYQDLRPEAWLAASESISGVTDRVSHNTAGMEATLERLAALVE